MFQATQDLLSVAIILRNLPVKNLLIKYNDSFAVIFFRYSEKSSVLYS